MARPASKWILPLLAAVVAGCGRDAEPPARVPGAADEASSVTGLLPAAGPRSLCGPGAEGFLAARLRGAIDADIDWRGDALECEGGMRPDRRGVRVSFAGELPAADGEPRRLRFIFGIDLDDTAPGKAQVLPTNLTVIVEGRKTLYSTRGDDRCAAEITARKPAADAGPGLDRLSVRGYCLVPAEDATGESRLLVPTFEFTGLVRTGEDP